MTGREAIGYEALARRRHWTRSTLAAALVLGLLPGVVLAGESREEARREHFSLLGLELTLSLQQVRDRHPAVSLRRVEWQSSFPELADQPRPPRAIVGWVTGTDDGDDTDRLIEFRFTGEGALYEVQVDVEAPETDCGARLEALTEKNGTPDIRAENYRVWRAIAPHQQEILEIHCRPNSGYIARLTDPAIRREYLARMAQRQQDELEQFGPKRSVPRALRQ